jgi:hypothetical protein
MHVATAPKTVVGHGQVEDQAPAARRVLEDSVTAVFIAVFVRSFESIFTTRTTYSRKLIRFGSKVSY